MRTPFIRREVWSYAILLVILFSIATIAVWQTIAYFESISSPTDSFVVPIIMWSLTLGFMLIAGAYGMWAIKFSAESESRRRIGRFVDAMNDFSDGLLAVDRRGAIMGSNPPADAIVNTNIEKNASIKALCPCLSDNDINLLLTSREPVEVERKAFIDGTSKTLRFRSQPSEDLSLITISDITSMNAEHQYNRQKARLQLVGQLSRGMAHDFNKILCEISGHVSLLARAQKGSGEMNDSLDSLKRNIERGIALSGNLTGLVQPDIAPQFTDSAGLHIQRAAEILKDSLSLGWQVVLSPLADDFPVVGLTGIQIEQIVLNLGMLAADTVTGKGIVSITAAASNADHPFNGGNQYAAVITVTTCQTNLQTFTGKAIPSGEPRESGIILSVIRSMIEEAGGSLDTFSGADGAPIFRVALPRANTLRTKDDTIELADELKTYLAQLSTLLAGSAKELGAIRQLLLTIGAKVEYSDNIMSVLARIENEHNLDVMIIGRHLLGQESKGLLKAMLKLRPTTGILVLCDDPAMEAAELSSSVIFESIRSSPNRILTSLLEAKSLAAARKHNRNV